MRNYLILNASNIHKVPSLSLLPAYIFIPKDLIGNADIIPFWQMSTSSPIHVKFHWKHSLTIQIQWGENKQFRDELLIPDGFINTWKEIQSEIEWQAWWQDFCLMIISSMGSKSILNIPHWKAGKWGSQEPGLPGVLLGCWFPHIAIEGTDNRTHPNVRPKINIKRQMSTSWLTGLLNPTTVYNCNYGWPTQGALK